MSKELLLARGLAKYFTGAISPTNTVSEQLLRFTRPRSRFYVFQDVDFTLVGGECVAIHGGNGTGKSTFLRCLGGVVEPSAGEVLPLGRLVSLLSHGYGAYEELSVYRNIVLAQQLLGVSLARARDNAGLVAEFAGLSDRMLGPTTHLSEGMRAKIPLSALAFAPFEVALLDESLNHVDSEFRQKFLRLTRKWISEGRSLLMTSHDEQLLQTFATRQLRIENKSFIEYRA